MTPRASLVPAAALAALLSCLVVAAPAAAQEETGAAPSSSSSSSPASSGAPTSPSTPAAARGSGLAVVAVGATRDDAFRVARSVYASALRPRNLDEASARALAGEEPSAATSAQVRDLASLRQSLGAGDDIATRKLLASIGRSLGTVGLLVVTPAPAVASPPAAAANGEVDAGPPASPAPPPTPQGISVRLFLTDLEDFDAARYGSDSRNPADPWKAMTASLERRFGVSAAAPVTARPAPPWTTPPARAPEHSESRPFYTSPWFWGAVGAAVLVGGAFYFASRDTSSEPIHLQMRVPR